jgi:alpha-beta hydrolase superfamily lysophospholipase
VLPATGAVIVLGGLSGWGAAYWPIADALAARGVAALLVEGPGQGLPRLRDGLVVGPDVHEGYSLFVDMLLARPDVHGPIGIWGNSFGGLFAALTAARDDRLAACCVNGAPAAPTVPEFRTAREQIFAAVGTDDETRARQVLDALRFDPSVERLTCAVLVLHGGADPLATLDDQRPFYEAGSPVDATLRIWDDGEHTIYNHAAERNSYAADWFADRLAGARERCSPVRSTDPRR